MKAKFPASIGHLREMLSWITTGLKGIKFDSKTLHKIEVASEEALVNVIEHAYKDRAEDVEIYLKLFPGHIEILIKDLGPAFNPLENAKKIDEDLSVEERPIGGLGIHLIRQCVDEVRYARENNANLLSLVKRIKS